jgi:aminoglycoside 6-adenylyltransferase
MRPLPTETEVLAWLSAWAIGQPAVRAVIMTSTRARPGGPVDALSDYDIILAVTTPEQFAHDDAWTLAYGQPMVHWGDQSQRFGFATYFRGVVYQDGVKIDWSLWPAALLTRIAAEPALPDQLDVGYRVLLDKDGQTAGWKPPTYQAHIPARPTEAEYLAVVQEFWWSTTYAAKSLWRDELVFARFCLDHEMKLDTLRRMLEWRMEIDRDWALKPGVLGRGLKQWLPADIWAELARTYVGPEIEANWEALFQLMALFRRVAEAVGDALGYTYPRDSDQRVSAYLSEIHGLPPESPRGM